MANIPINQLPTAGTIVGTELVPIVQDGQTRQTTTAAIAASPAQSQTFLTLNQEPTLPNSRRLTAGTGLGLTDGGALSTLALSLNGASGSLETALTGIVAKTGSVTVVARTLTASGLGLSITNGSGVVGDPTFALTGLAADLANLSGPGLVSSSGSGLNPRVLLGTASEIDVANGDGASGNPTVGLADNPIIPGTGGVKLPTGTTAERNPNTNGYVRYNTDLGVFEGYAGGSWQKIFSGGQLAVADGGTGASSAVNARANLSAAVSGANNDITSLSAVTGGISTPDFVQLDTAAGASSALGRLRWNATTATAAFGIVGGTEEVNIGQQMYAHVTNAESVPITRGQAVYLFEATGNRASVKLANNTGDATSAKTLGLVAENSIGAGQAGFVITQGVLDKLNTAAFLEGTTLYLGATAGSLTSTKPAAPNHLVYIGVVERANAGNGQIYVRTQNGYELDEIHDVLIVSPTNGQVLAYESSTDLWKNSSAPILSNVTVTGTLGYRTGTGGTVTQSGSRTSGVTLDKINGQITLVSAAGSASWQTFTVTNNTVAATDVIIVNQDVGTDRYMTHVTKVQAGSFDITFATTGGTTTEQPVFNFAVIKAVNA